MDLHLEKCMRIINDLVSFCHFEGAEEFQIYMTHHKIDHASIITLKCPIPDLPPETVKALTDELNLPRQREVEQDYWALSGESELSEELTLVGMMIDEATVGYKDGTLYIHIRRCD